MTSSLVFIERKSSTLKQQKEAKCARRFDWKHLVEEFCWCFTVFIVHSSLHNCHWLTLQSYRSRSTNSRDQLRKCLWFIILSSSRWVCFKNIWKSQSRYDMVNISEKKSIPTTTTEVFLDNFSQESTCTRLSALLFYENNKVRQHFFYTQIYAWLCFYRRHQLWNRNFHLRNIWIIEFMMTRICDHLLSFTSTINDARLISGGGIG